MNPDRFKNYGPDVRQLVLAFEGEEGRRFFDVEELEVIADYYLEVYDTEGLEAAVRLGELLYPNNSEIRLRRAQLLGVQGFYQQALRMLKQLERDDPSNTDICYSLGTLYSMTGHAKESIDYYLRAAADGYELGMIYGSVADEYIKLGNTVQAVRYYRKALLHNPNEERWLYGLSNIWEMQSRYGQAVQFFSRHVADHPYNKAAWYCLGSAYLWGQQYDKALAVDAFEYALAIDSTFENAYIALAEAYISLNDMPHAVQALRDVLGYASDRPYILHSIGLLYMEAGNYHTAYTYFHDAIKEDSSRGHLWNDLGVCSEKMGYLDEAAGHYNHAINLDPECDDYWLNLADLYIDQLRFAEAAALLESARQEATNQYLFDNRLLYCYYKLGRRNRFFNLLAEDMSAYASQLSYLLSDYPEMAQDLEVVNAIAEINKLKYNL